MSKAGSKERWELCAVPVPELMRERYERLHSMMDAEGLDALVVLAPAVLGRKGSARYVTNYIPVSRYSGVVFSRHDPPVLFVPTPVHQGFAGSTTWVEDVRTSADFATDMAALLREWGFASGRIGLVGGDTIAGFGAALGEGLPGAAVTAVDAPFTRLRMVKGPLETRMARHAASLADQVFAEAATLVADGATEAEIYAAGEATLRRSNSEECLLLIDSQGGQIMPLPTQREVAAGDLVQYSVEPVSPGGHWIQSIRMFSRGEPDSLTRQTVESATRALAAGEAALSPGVPLSEVARAMADVLASVAPQGVAPYGHGIGMDNFEPPVLSVNSDVVAEANMVMALHPALVAEGRNFYIGDTYMVTETGAERLSHYPLDLVVV